MEVFGRHCRTVAKETNVRWPRGPTAPETVIMAERAKIKLLLRAYCDKKGIPYRKISTKQAIKALKKNYEINSGSKLIGLLQRWWIHSSNLGEVMQRVEQDAKEELEAITCKTISTLPKSKNPYRGT